MVLHNAERQGIAISVHILVYKVDTVVGWNVAKEVKRAEGIAQEVRRGQQTEKFRLACRKG